MNEDDIVIVSAVRKPIGIFNGLLKDVTAVQLGALVIRAAISNVSPILARSQEKPYF